MKNQHYKHEETKHKKALYKTHKPALHIATLPLQPSKSTISYCAAKTISNILYMHQNNMGTSSDPHNLKSPI